MRVIILEKSKEVHSSDHVKCVTLPSESGEICVYPDHMSIITLMSSGIIYVTYIENGIEKQYNVEISEGIFSFKDNTAVCLIAKKI